MSDPIWRPRTSVKVRFALAQGLIIGFIIAFLAIALYFPVQQHLGNITDASYRLLANNLASSIYNPYSNHDQTEITTDVRRVEGQQGVKYVLIVDGTGTVVYDSIAGDQSLLGKQYRDSLSDEVVKGDLAVGKVTRDGVSYYNYVAPFIASNQVVYTVRLGIDEGVIDGELSRISSLFMYLAVFGVLMGVVAAYLLASKLTKPIVMLTESALAIRAGNLNAYPDITTNDELEQLSREFQNMVEKLKQYYFQEYTQKKQALVAKQRLEELDRQKSDFMNAASHQLRTPLSIIHWSLSLIVEEAASLNIPHTQRELLEESLKSTKRMVDLVNDLLNISRIEQGRKELQWGKANYGVVCEQVTKALQVLAANKKLALTYEQKGEIPDSFLDEKEFYQVVSNFVDNSIKYTNEGYVKVSVEAKDNTVVIVVRDSGIGMDANEKKRLFTRFVRGNEASKMFANGSGLGMYVAQAILKQHGGSVEVVSEKGEGSTFTITVPLYEVDPTKKAVSEVMSESELEKPAIMQPKTSTL